MCENINFTVPINTCSVVVNPPIYSFKDDKCYLNGNYFGDIKTKTDKKIVVICKNGNQYMQNKEIIFRK